MDDLKNISELELVILNIAETITQKKVLTIEELYREAKKKLPNFLSEEINKTIYDLILKKLIIPEKKLVKTQVLANKKRDAIYKYILNNPGAHLREIRDKLKSQPHVTNLHLKVLENFGFIYRKPYQKYRVYFPAEFIRTNEDIILALKNDKAESIFLMIYKQGEIALDKLKEKFSEQISSKMINYHLEPLLSCDLVSSFKKDGKEFLKINAKTFEKVEKYLRPIIERPPVPEEGKLPAEREEAIPSIPEKILVKRAYDYVGGNIRFKVIVENPSKEIIKDISVLLNVKEQYEVSNPEQKISLLEPEESRGVDFTLTPLACGKSKVHGTVSFWDAKGQFFSTEISPVLCQIKCPLVTPKILKLLDVLKLKERFQVSHVEIPYIGLSQASAYKLARDQISSLDVSEIEAGGEDFTALFSGEAKITKSPLLVDLHIENMIIIDVYMEDVKQATGFLAYIKNLINVALRYTVQISTSIERISTMIFNSFEFSSRLSELFALCETEEPLDDILLLLKELQIKSRSYFQDLKLTEMLNKWFDQLEKLQGKQIFNRTYLNLQFEIQSWLETVITFSETNAKIYYDSAIDQNTRQEIANGISKLKKDLDQIMLRYSRKILYMFMLIHKNTGLSLYNHNFTDQKMDSDLLSGFLTAIQSFGTEISVPKQESKQESKMKRLSYEHFEIEISDGALTIAALITTGYSNQLTSMALKRFVQRFEAQFTQEIESFKGNVSQFASARDLIQEIFLH